MKKRILSLALCLAMIISLLPQVELFAQAASSGTCGENLTWTLDDVGTLTISGTGAMTNFWGSSPVPWGSVRSSIKSVVINNGVTSIGDTAFENCDNLISITIPNSVLSIGDTAFQFCTSLTNITIPSSVTSIGDHAFSFTSIASLTIPNGVIGDFAFFGCEGLTNVTIGDRVTRIEDHAFLNCENLTNVTILNSAMSISSSAFDDCDNLVISSYSGSAVETYACEYNIPFKSLGVFGTCGENLTWVLNYGTLTISGTGAMSDWTFSSYAPWYSLNQKITNVVIEDGVTSIGKCAFYNCFNLTSITIPNSVTSIGGNAFTYCTSLIEITIPGSVKSIGEAAFNFCEKLESVMLSSGLIEIASFAFMSCKSLTNIVIPDTVTEIGIQAFSGCISLTSITIPESVTRINDMTFDACPSLTSVTIPASVTSIGNRAFSDCNNLTISSYSGSYAETYASENNIPFEAIGAGGTCGENLTWTLDDEGTLTISGTGDMANYHSYNPRAPWYSSPTSIKSVVINNGATSIGKNAFYNCRNLTSITIPGSVTSIGEYAFCKCTSLTSIIIPDSVTSIERYAFSECTNLTSITIPSSVTSIEYSAFSECTNLVSVTIPDSVTSIGDWAFYKCTSLTSITIPDSVTSIGDYAFRYCSNLTSITIPSSVTSIGVGAFSVCNNLTISGYRGSYAETYANENNIPFVAIDAPEVIDYKFGQTVQIGLIEPWFLKANLRVYTADNPTNIDYSTLKDYGVYFVRKSSLADGVTQATATAEQIVNNADTVKCTKADGTAFIDGSYLSAQYEKGIYTYELSDSVFVMFYIEDAAGVHYAPIRERNLYELAKTRSKDTSGDFGDLEKSVYSAMVAMYDAITEYRNDYYSKK